MVCKKTEARHRRESKIVQDAVDEGQFIDVLGCNDIPQGRGHGSSNSAASQRFREIVNYQKHLEYTQASSSRKKNIQESLYTEITEENGLRFVHKVNLVMSGGDNPHWILYNDKAESTSFVVEKWIPQPKLLSLKKILNRLNDVKDGEVATVSHAASSSGPPVPSAHDGDDEDTPMDESNMKLSASPSSTLVQSFQYVPPSSQQTQATARYLPAVVSPAAVMPNPSSPPSQQAGILNQGKPHQGANNGVLILSLLPIAGPAGNGPAPTSTIHTDVPISRPNAAQPSPSSLLLPMLLASLNEEAHHEHRAGTVAPPSGGNTSKILLNQLSGSVVHHIAEKFGSIATTSS